MIIFKKRPDKTWEKSGEILPTETLYCIAGCPVVAKQAWGSDSVPLSFRRSWSDRPDTSLD
jgi:hypothetical protein